MQTNFFEKINNIKFQIFCIFFVIFYIITLFILEHKKDIYREPIYPLIQVEESIKQVTSNVSVGLCINNFSKFSFYQNEFVLDGFIWFRFPIGTDSLKTIERFDFQDGEILYKSDPMIKLIDQDVLITYQIKVNFKAQLNYKKFPIGDHRLNIILAFKNFTPNELCLNSQQNNFSLNKNLNVSSWKPVKQYVSTGYIQADLKPGEDKMKTGYPCAVFTIDFENTSYRDLITLYFPMYVIFFICLFSLLIDIKEYIARLAITSETMPILLLFKTVILQISPSVGSITEISDVDFAYFLLVFLCFLIVIFQLYEALIMRKIVEYTEEEQKIKIAHHTNLSSLLFLVIMILLISALTLNALFL